MSLKHTLSNDVKTAIKTAASVKGGSVADLKMAQATWDHKRNAETEAAANAFLAGLPAWILNEVRAELRDAEDRGYWAPLKGAIEKEANRRYRGMFGATLTLDLVR